MLHELTSLVLPLLPEFDLPPLPPIVNEHLARLVVTHSSFHSEPKQATSLELKRSNPTDNYEKLEHVGDALLGAVATTVLQDLYADLPPGTATILKSHLINNRTLAQICVRYGIMETFIAAPSALYTARMQTKVQASVLEAYMAGVFYDYLTSDVPGAYEDETASVDAVADAESIRDDNFDDSGSNTPSHSGSMVHADDDTKDPSSRSLSFAFNQVSLSSEAPSRASSIAPVESAYRPSILPTPLPALRPKHERTRGDAFTYLEHWLRPLLEPVAHFALNFMRESAKEIQQAVINKKIDDPTNDAVATGATGALNSWLQTRNGSMPVYEAEAVGLRWRGICRCTYEGVTYSGDAVRDSKKAAWTVAAWKVCKQVGFAV